MKLKFVVALTLTILVGAALWRVNRGAQHPSANADAEFRALVAGADAVSVEQLNRKHNNTKVWIMLTPAGKRTLLQELRFDAVTSPQNSAPRPLWELNYQRKNQTLVSFQLAQSPTSSVLTGGSKQRSFRLNARSDAALRRAFQTAGMIMCAD